MTTVRLLGKVFRETLRLIAADPIGMVAVLLARVFDGNAAAQARLTKVIDRAK